MHHPRIIATGLTLRDYLNVLNLKEKIKRIIEKCYLCSTTKSLKGNYGLQTSIIKLTVFLDIISSDVLDLIETEFFKNDLIQRVNFGFWLP